MPKPRALLVHWKKEELPPKLKLLRSLGYTVISEHGEGTLKSPELRKKTPSVAVIYLSRLPSHGRQMAEALLRSSYTRDVLIVFVNGEQERVAEVQRKIQHAIFTTEAKLPDILRQHQLITLFQSYQPPSSERSAPSWRSRKKIRSSKRGTASSRSRKKSSRPTRKRSST